MELSVPGDKSITQRALILSALADGESALRGLLPAEDPRATAAALRGLGVDVPDLPADGREIRVRGGGLRGLRAPRAPLDFRNSGTGARLVLGVLAAQPFTSVVTGDPSLRSRPMGRVTRPLSAMGARFESLEVPDRLPLRVRGGELGPLDYPSPVASAQVKSALLLAGLAGRTFVLVTEPGPSRDHTERMLAAAGAPVVTHRVREGWRVELRDPPERLRPMDLTVPGDASSAAFFLVLALLGGAGSGLTVRGVGLNPTRTGVLDVLQRMGGDLEVTRRPGEEGGEPVGDVHARPSRLKAVDLEGPELVRLIDEVPVLAAAAARAEGTTRIAGAAELRVKETDRIDALVSNLRELGVVVEELEDGLVVRGSDRPLRGRVRARHDHRIAMAFGVLGALPANAIEVDDPAVVAVSYPGFWHDLERVRRSSPRGATERSAAPPVAVREERGDEAGASASGGAGAVPPSGPAGTKPSPEAGPASAPDRREGPVVTIDGPAGSGKSTTAREVARRLGFRHLDSGALYRGLTWALLEAGVEPERWSELDREHLEAFPVRLEPTPEGYRLTVAGREVDRELRSEAVTHRVSALSGVPAVRGWLLDVQREAGRVGRLVADGRDMGTVVFPDADVKIFLTADLPERARRRLLQQGASVPDEEHVAAEARRIRERDRRDSEREISPLRKPEDAIELDTTELDFEAQVEAVVERVRGLTTP